MHGGAFCELTLDGDVTAALANNSIASSEAEPAAMTIIFRGKERFEKMLFYLLAHPHAVIDHANADIFAAGSSAGDFPFVEIVSVFNTSVPPAGIASRALTARLIMIWVN